jgi:hypothetical protein
VLPIIILTISCVILIALGNKFNLYVSDVFRRINGRNFILKAVPAIRFITWFLLTLSLSTLIAPPTAFAVPVWLFYAKWRQSKQSQEQLPPPSLTRKWLAPGLFVVGFIALISAYNIESEKSHNTGLTSAAAYNEAQKLGINSSQYKEFDTKRTADKAVADEASRKKRAETYA